MNIELVLSEFQFVKDVADRMMRVGGLVVSHYAPNRVGGGFDSFPSQLVGYKLCLREQVVVQLRGMHLMIGATLKSEYGQVVVKTQTNN